MGVADPLETRFFQTRVIVPNLVGVGRTVWVLAGTQKLGGRWAPDSLGWGVADPQGTRSCLIWVTVPNLVTLAQIIWALEHWCLLLSVHLELPGRLGSSIV